MFGARGFEPPTPGSRSRCAAGLRDAPKPAPGEHKKVRVDARRQVAYLLPFEIVSVHLLVVLIGAAYLARAKRRRGVVTP